MGIEQNGESAQRGQDASGGRRALLLLAEAALRLAVLGAQLILLAGLAPRALPPLPLPPPLPRRPPRPEDAPCSDAGPPSPDRPSPMLPETPDSTLGGSALPMGRTSKGRCRYGHELGAP